MSSHAAVQYLKWALEEIEQLGDSKAARHVADAMKQLSCGSSATERRKLSSASAVQPQGM